MTPGYDGVIYLGVFLVIMLIPMIFDVVRWIRGKE